MKKLIITSLILTVLYSCIEQIPFDEDSSGSFVVVDGVFTNQYEKQKIKLSHSIQLNSQVNVPLEGAEVTVEDNDGKVIDFIEEKPGEYTNTSVAEKGKQYRLKATLPDGRNMSSDFQQVPNSLQIQGIETIDTAITFVNGSGRNQRSYLLEFYATIAQDSVQNDLFLRYNTQTVYQVLETQCSPFHTVKACYFYNDSPPQSLTLLEVEKQASPISLTSKIYSREINYHLAEVFALDLSLYSYNKSEYEYWRKLKLLFDQDGNITAALPAKLIGNIAVDSGTAVLGQFAVVGKSSAIKLVRNEGFSPTQLPFCGIAGNRPWPLPDECCNCLGLKGAVTEKPDYWP